MKVGDIVRVKTRSGNRIGVLVSTGKKRFMIGTTAEVMIDGVVKEVITDKITLVQRRKNESKASD